MYSLVTVVHSPDFASLKLQALSVQKFLKASIAEVKIFIVLNDSDIHLNFLKESIVPLYGQYAPCCRVLTRSDLRCGNEFVHGWVQQQIYKLAIANFIEDESYLVLDSKNHLIRDFDLSIELSKPLKWVRVNRNGHLSEGFERSYKYFELVPKDHIEYSAANVTPFVFHTKAVLDMIDTIESRESCSFFDFFSVNKMHEFDLYSAYVIANPKWIYLDREKNFITLFKDKVTDDNNFGSMMFQAKDSKIKFFAIHHAAYSCITPAQKDVIKEFWVNMGLFQSVESAEGFL